MPNVSEVPWDSWVLGASVVLVFPWAWLTYGFEPLSTLGPMVQYPGSIDGELTQTLLGSSGFGSRGSQRNRQLQRN